MDSKFVNEKMTDKAGTEHGFTYKRCNGKDYPADLAYYNRETEFRIYFVYDHDFADKTKPKAPVFESTDDDGNVSVFEVPSAEADVQAVVRTVFMF